MAVIKPYTFVAGTKAKAAEVNEDFDVLYTEVNALGSTVVDYQSQIEQLASEKANVNGNYANRFSVANPTTNYDAVNKQTLFNTISNSLPYIYGLGITKVGDNTISVAAGECYDTTETTLLKLSGNLEKQNQTQAASSSYYVYIIGGANVNEDILISTLSLDPNLPDGYTLSRRIGSYTTDSSNKILQVTNEQVSQYTINNLVAQNIESINADIVPTYKSGWVTIGSGYVTPKAGLIFAQGRQDNFASWIQINSFRADFSYDRDDGQSWGSAQLVVPKGATVTFGNTNTVWFIPNKGV
jgi:hypothetical protein